ncbi:MAG: SpoIIE family protein phosphatase [Solirubrobacteraceae bacterium]
MRGHERRAAMMGAASESAPGQPGEMSARHRLVSDVGTLVPGILYVYDLEQGHTVIANTQVSEVLGWEDEAIGRFGDAIIEQLLHPDDAADLQAHLAALRRLADGESRQVRCRFRHADGSYRWFENRDAVLARGPDGGVVEIIGVASDITERVHSEHALRVAAEQNHYRALLADELRVAQTPEDVERTAPRLLCLHLAATRAQYTETVEAGAGLAAVALASGTTLRVDDVSTDPGLSELQRNRSAEHAVAACVVVPLMRAGQAVAVLAVEQSTPRTWTDAEVALIEETAKRTRMSVERTRALADLSEREASYRSLFRSIDEGFCLCEMVCDADGEPVDYRFLEVNERFKDHTGMLDPVGRTAREMVPDLELHWVQTMARVGIGGETLRYENSADSMSRHFDLFAAPVEPIGCGRFLVVVNDVTERKRAETTLRENAAMARRGRARTELVASVMTELETFDGLAPLMDGLVTSLVPKLADYAILEIPGRVEPVLAISHRDPELVGVLRALRDRQRASGDPGSLLRAARGEALLLERITPDMLIDGGIDEPTLALYQRLGPRSHIAVPVDVTGEPGALLLGLSDPGRRPYGIEELSLVQELARRSSVLLARARVREDEHRIGVRLQRALLPDELLRHPAIQVAASYQTSSDLLSVGGDWYDTLALPDGRIALAVGDVVGHGLEAAAAMSRMRIALAALAPGAPSPGVLLSRLGDFAAGANGVEFATLTCGFLDPVTGILRYASAGHPPILVASADGATRWLDEGRSMPLGSVSMPGPRAEAETTLRSGDLIVLYSDGLVERRHEPITTGLDRLAHAAGGLVDRSVEDVCGELLARTMRGSRSEDDAVILCVRFGRVSDSVFERRMPATADQLAPARTELLAWLARTGAHNSLPQRLLLAVGEALSNAVEHAYQDRLPGSMELAVHVDGTGGLAVTVSDRGRWNDRPSGSGRGRGLAVIDTLSSELQRHSDATGTTVSFTVPIEEETI